MHYTKLFGDILLSSVWSQTDSDTKVVWITMLAMSDREGYVGASVLGLAHAAGVGLESTEKALKTFLSPDPYSRSPEYEGRKIEVAERGWRILNYTKFRQLMSREDRLEYFRRKQAEYRKRKREAQKGVRTPVESIRV